MFDGHNDYEILHLIENGNEDALILMFDKYYPLISKKILHFNLQYDYEDMVQEAHMILLKSIRMFDSSYKKTFTRYFEQNLMRHFITIVSKRVRRSQLYNQNENYIMEHNHASVESPYYNVYKNQLEKILTKTEYLVYTLRELKNYSVDYIVKQFEFNRKTVYNSLHRAKVKIKEHFSI